MKNKILNLKYIIKIAPFFIFIFSCMQNKIENFTMIKNEKKISIKFGKIEASGIIKSNNNFIIISDDTKNKKPYVFIADSSGNIIKKSKMIFRNNTLRINDMEGIAKDSTGFFYITTSLSVNKKGKIDNSRKIVIKVLEKNLSIISVVNLYEIIKNSKIPFLQKSIKDNTIDIEALSYYKGNLFFGLKNPLSNDKAVILKVVDLFGVAPKVSIFKELKLGEGIIALHSFEDNLLISSKFNNTSSKIWKYNMNNDQLSEIFHLNKKRIEGITIKYNQLILVQDGNSSKSSIFFMENKNE